jgi:putative transcriptional regulator
LVKKYHSYCLDLKDNELNDPFSYEGKLLLAMPGMGDPRFERSVIYMCSHSKNTAMGLIINQPVTNLNFSELLDQLDINVEGPIMETSIHAGGPVETGRGFVLHSADYVQDSTLIVSETLALTATVDILRAIATGKGPINHLLALGYSGWSGKQLEQEIQTNAWLTAPADDEVIFHTELEDKWPRAMAMLGVDIAKLSSDAGHA